MKDQSLRVLMIDDSEDDVLLIIRKLKSYGYSPLYEWMDNSASMKKAIREKQWDIILCDYQMPNFNVSSAFALLNESVVDVPLIVVSGISDEDVVTECMHLGARDYVTKSNLSRLGPAITRELETAEFRRKYKRAENELQQTMDGLKSTLQVMVAAVEAREPYKAGHQIGSAKLACAIAAEMGLAQEKTNNVHVAASLHDIGKLSIPAEILAKPLKLTELEFSLVKEHSLCGYQILTDAEFPLPMAQIVHQHHERMDGSGYPQKLKGDEILMEARIVAVSDVVTSMASNRPYRRAPGLDAALEEIEANSGILYDAAVADACLNLFRKRGYQIS